jgi:glycosyltransferase involved in cell wall biosynthesis
MTALVVADVFFPETIGGAGRVARELAQGLAREMAVVVVSRNEGGHLAPVECADGLEIHRFLVDRSNGARFFLSAMRNSIALVRRLTRARQFDRLIIHQPLSGIAALPLIKSIPTVYVFHSPWGEEYRLQIGAPEEKLALQQRAGAWARWRTEHSLVRRAKRVMVLSQYMEGQLERLHQVPAERLARIPGGVDVDRFRPGRRAAARKLLGLPERAELVVTVRNLVARMGLSGLVDAFHQLTVRRPNARLLIAGSGPLAAALEYQIVQLRLADRVLLLGSLPDDRLPDIYRAADVFVLPTRDLEGFGLVTIEALSSGLPVVATPVGASPEILTQLDPSLLARSSSSQDIAEALDAFLSRPAAERKRLAKRGRELCVGRYSWSVVTQAFNELVRSVR